jgi:hypothetical protein
VGYVVATLSPYHCTLNLTELVWSQVKGLHTLQDTTKHSNCMTCLALSTFALSQIMSQRWQAITDHVTEVGRMWELDGITDNMVDQLVTNKGNAETSSNEESVF